MNYYEFIKQTQFLKDKIILPNGNRIDKSRWLINGKFDFDKFNKYLLDTYNEVYDI